MFCLTPTPISLQTDSARFPPACSPSGYQRVWAILTRLLGACFVSQENVREARRQNAVAEVRFCFADANAFEKAQRGDLGQHPLPQSREMKQQPSSRYKKEPWLFRRGTPEDFSLNTRPPLETANRLQVFKPPSVPFLQPHPPLKTRDT